MNIHHVIVGLLWLVVAGGCEAGTTGTGASTEAFAVDEAREAKARAAAAEPLEQQAPEVVANHQEGERRARALMIAHARERVAEIRTARQSLSNRPGSDDALRREELGKALELAETHLRNVQQGLGREVEGKGVAASSSAP